MEGKKKTITHNTNEKEQRKMTNLLINKKKNKREGKKEEK